MHCLYLTQEAIVYFHRVHGQTFIDIWAYTFLPGKETISGYITEFTLTD